MGSNPYLPAPQEPVSVESIEDDQILGSRESISGLSNPRALREVSPAPETPAASITPSSVWLVGASGGVGTSTLAKLAGENIVDGGVQPPMWQAPAVIVASTHAAGLDAAAELARANARGNLAYDVLALVLVHDRPKLSKPAITRARAVGGMYPLVMTVPFEPAWREPGVIPTESNVRLRKVLKNLRTITEKKESK